MSFKKSKTTKIKLFLIIVISILAIQIFQPNFVYSKDDEVKEQVSDKAQQYTPETIRARLPEARKCVTEKPGNSWSECRFNCADICNEIIETYTRGVCNGVLIQACCGQHPSGCK